MYSADEGDLYKIVNLGGRTFELRFGYYEEYERESISPVPIYPDFIRTPVYSDDGRPFVTQMQELCEYGESRFDDGCCVDCEYFRHGEELIGFCQRAERRLGYPLTGE